MAEGPQGHLIPFILAFDKACGSVGYVTLALNTTENTLSSKA